MQVWIEAASPHGGVVADALVTGHLGVTEASVEGCVGVGVSPLFSHRHPRLVPGTFTVEVALNGSVASCAPLPTARLAMQSAHSKTLVNEKMVFHEPLSVGRWLTQGDYRVPFRFKLASVLPPSFHGRDARVTYSVSATVKVSEYVGPRSTIKEHVQSVQQKVRIQLSASLGNKRFNPEHIVGILSNISVPWIAEPVPEEAAPPAKLLSHDMAVNNPPPTSNSSPCQLRHTASFASLNASVPMRPPTPSPSITDSAIGDIPTTLTTANPTTKNFKDPYTTIHSNLHSVSFSVHLAQRAFGPDEEIKAIVTVINSLPNGLQICGVNACVMAHVRVRGVAGSERTREVPLFRHHIIPAIGAPCEIQLRPRGLSTRGPLPNHSEVLLTQLP
ncbi:hypothetical protein BC830DRAFT_1086668, partial [Chytriomyces sp. MP71]